MGFSEKFVRAQIARFGRFAGGLSLKATRVGQTKIHSIISSKARKKVRVDEERVGDILCAMTLPKEITRDGVILYLHGGGYCAGDLAYAKSFSAALAVRYGVRVYTVEYRLAPEFPFPAALEDALAAYKRLIECGYHPEDILLCGESAGGGLIYSLCLRLKELGLERPAGLIAISPWVDLTASGKSYEENAGKDISMTVEQLEFFASHYTNDRKNPLVSPIFGDLCGMPPSLIFAGGDEIMLDDAVSLHEKLTEAGAQSELTVAPPMWHAYLMYDLNESEADFAKIGEFLDKFLSPARGRMWLKLDNAAKIYPAARTRNWSNLFRLSATLADEIDTEILKVALGATVRRFPSVAVRLSFGAFWYYLEELTAPPEIRGEYGHPTENMKYADIRKCAFRVLVFGKRVAIEFFHSITDGTGGMVFFKSLLAEYIERKYGEKVPCEKGVVDRRGEIDAGELEDSFLKYAGDVPMSRKETTAFILDGKKEKDGFVHALTFIAESEDIRKLAKSYGVSVTAFLSAVMMQAFSDIQEEQVADRTKRKPIKIMLPVNLRNIFPSKTLRNFALYIIPEISPAMGEHSFDEICRSVHHQMGFELTANRMRARITTNVNDEKNPLVKVTPLFLKNAVMKGVFNAVGEKTSCITLSNLGVVELPEAMEKYEVIAFEFIRIDNVVSLVVTQGNSYACDLLGPVVDIALAPLGNFGI